MVSGSKKELHAHLNGSLSKATIMKLYEMKNKNSCDENALSCCQSSGSLSKCFGIFQLIHDITDTTSAIFMATEDVIADFYNDGVKYLELRSTPREVPGHMTRCSYVDAMLSAIKKSVVTYPDINVKLLLAIDRRNSVSAAEETVKIAESHLNSNSPVVCGIDLSGDPSLGDVQKLIPVLEYAKKVGLKLSLHMGEIAGCDEEIAKLLRVEPNRIGHGTFIHPEKGGTRGNFEHLMNARIPLELCLTSNVISHTVSSYRDHHFHLWRAIDYPFAICTDDKGVFNTSLSEEYYLIHKHLGITPEEMWEISYKSIDYTFAAPIEQTSLREFWKKSKEELFKILPEELRRKE